MRALIEKVIRAVAVPEIVELPRLIGGTTIPHQLLIDKHFNGTKIPCEVARIGRSGGSGQCKLALTRIE
jgi:hypothetical protein